MSNTVLGKVMCTPRGAYNVGTAYEVLDIVSYQSGSYLACKDNPAGAPNNDGVSWMQLAAQGGTGDPGAAAGFGKISATADNTSSDNPTVEVSTSGPATALAITFQFSGFKGSTGDTPELSMGTVETLEPTEDATASFTGTAEAPVLNLGIPQGQPGTSVASIQRTSGTGAAGTTDTYTMYDSAGSAIGTFTVYNGANGAGSGDFLADGSVPMSGALQMGGNRITNVGAPSQPTDAVRQSDLEAVAQEVDNILDGTTPPVIPAATTVKAGVVMVGSGLAVTEDGTLSVPRDQTPTQGSENPVESGGVYSALQGYLPTTQKGAAGGLAELDSNGLVPASQLPGFVDDVVDAYVVGSTPYASDWLSLSAGGAPLTPAASAIYLVVSAGTYQNQQYRWSGTQYAEISSSLALGETADTAYRGDRGKAAYDHSQITQGNPHGTTAADVGARPDTWTPSAADVGAAKPGDVFTVTLLASGWSEKSQTVNDERFVTSGYAFITNPADASFTAWAEAVIHGQDVTVAGQMTFTCAGDAPTGDITVKIIRLEATEA